MKTKTRTRRHKRIFRNMKGTKACPRLVVFRSKKHMYAQLVDDTNKKVLTGRSTLSKSFREKSQKSTNRDAAKEVGKLIAQLALKSGIKTVCFDRAGYKYHGKVKALAEGARQEGLKF